MGLGQSGVRRRSGNSQEGQAEAKALSIWNHKPWICNSSVYLETVADAHPKDKQGQTRKGKGKQWGKSCSQPGSTQRKSAVRTQPSSWREEWDNRLLWTVIRGCTQAQSGRRDSPPSHTGKSSTDSLEVAMLEWKEHGMWSQKRWLGPGSASSKAVWHQAWHSTSLSFSSLWTVRWRSRFIIAKTCKQPKCPSTDKWKKKTWCIHMMKYYSV